MKMTIQNRNKLIFAVRFEGKKCRFKIEIFTINNLSQGMGKN